MAQKIKEKKSQKKKGGIPLALVGTAAGAAVVGAGIGVAATALSNRTTRKNLAKKADKTLQGIRTSANKTLKKVEKRSQDLTSERQKATAAMQGGMTRTSAPSKASKKAATTKNK